MQEKLRTIIATHTGQPYDRIAKDTDRDFYLSAEQAVEYGLVDEILVKEEPEESKESKD
jgi:ATP-dependent Clp protease protease subunit